MDKHLPNKKQKQRSPNFTPEEKILLLTLVHDERDIIENKKTDAVSNRDKQNCWEEITRKFNSLSPGGFVRSSTCLQKFYTNKKKEARIFPFYKRKTGGQPSEKKKEDPNIELLLATMNKYSVYGLTDHFGDDKSYNQEENDENHHINHDHGGDGKDYIFVRIPSFLK
ncbi:hypothetical protein Zmor_000867 [Zophobas morio]|uniref:Regulatory protein zeste n=1 Tax=Zophobas morio TaxID=2755281 RepID=A0AA38IY48_9CUCU|nr:hypothetical protein Zmor_000867 [Zophobas morio]